MVDVGMCGNCKKHRGLLVTHIVVSVKEQV